MKYLLLNIEDMYKLTSLSNGFAPLTFFLDDAVRLLPEHITGNKNDIDDVSVVLECDDPERAEAIRDVINGMAKRKMGRKVRSRLKNSI